MSEEDAERAARRWHEHDQAHAERVAEANLKIAEVNVDGAKAGVYLALCGLAAVVIVITAVLVGHGMDEGHEEFRPVECSESMQ